MVAAFLLYVAKRSITYQGDLMLAAQRMVPVLLGLMAWAFVSYLLLKGLRQVIAVSFWFALLAGAVAALATFALMRVRIAARAQHLSNDKDGVNGLFTVRSEEHKSELQSLMRHS